VFAAAAAEEPARVRAEEMEWRGESWGVEGGEGEEEGDWEAWS